MNASIHTRIVLSCSILVLVVGLTAGWIGTIVVGRVIEQRLVHDTVADAAGLVIRLRLPLSDTLMQHLRQILGSDMAAGPAATPEISSSNLPQTARAELQQWLTANPTPQPGTVLNLNRSSYRLGFADIPGNDNREPMRLYLLASENDLRLAKRRANAPIAATTGIAVLIALLTGHWLSASISRPIKKLAAKMNRLSNSSTDTEPEAPKKSTGLQASGPAELNQLGTAFERLLEHLRQARLELLQSERLNALGELATSIVHECRNPLSGISMNARILKDELARAGITDDRSIELIISEIERLDIYLQELLGFAGNGAEQSTDNGRELKDGEAAADMKEAVTAVLHLLQGRCRHAEVQVHTDFCAFPDRCMVKAGINELKQVLLNLCLNALDAMPDGGELRISCQPVEHDKGRIRVLVDDTGTGIKAVGGLDIFAAFVSTKQHGAGLGLHVCRKIIESRGGTIAYDNLNPGTSFRFELPVPEKTVPQQR